MLFHEFVKLIPLSRTFTHANLILPQTQCMFDFFLKMK